mgnify:FL=1
MDMDWENYSRMRKSNGERQRTNSYRTQSYIDGNTVYKTDALPKRREREETQRQVQRTPQRKPVRMAGISAKGFAFLSVMTAVVLFFAFQYLSTQYQVNHTKEEVVRLPMRRKIMKVTIRRSQILLTLQKFMKKQRRS